MPSVYVKPVKITLIVVAIIASLFMCLLIAACGLRAAQSGQAGGAVLNAPPVPVGAARETALRAGRETVHLIGERNGKALFEKFTSEMAADVPQPAFDASIKTGPAPRAGTPVGEIVSGKEKAPIYYGLYPMQNGEGQLAVIVTFSSERCDKIAGLLMTPQPKSASQEAAIQQGRTVATLVAKKDLNGLYALFSPNMARALPKATIQNVLEEMITTKKPVGAKVGEIVVPAGRDENGPLAYAAEFAYGPGNTLKVLMSFDADTKKLTSLRLVPGLPRILEPDPHAGYVMKTHLKLPFVPGDKWTIVWGGDTREQNYHVDYPDQRHAFDIVAMQNGKSHTGNGKTLSQYFAWGRKIVAPADAAVLEAVDGLPDNTPGKMDPAHAAGNHVILDFGNNEYALLGHMQKGSIKVKAGQKVKGGDLLGLCGNSGNTSEPHLHFHVQDGPGLFRAKGLPVTFWDYVSNGKPVKSGSPVQKEVVEAER